MASRVILLGPQRFQPTVRDVLRELGTQGLVAVVTAGWQEREGENDELRAHLDRELVDLRLYHRYDDVMLRDRELAAALRRRQERLQELQQLYRLRLDHALAAARQLLERRGRSALLEEQRRAAILALKSLDRRHLGRLRRLHAEFEREWRVDARDVVRRHVDQLRRIVEPVGVLAITGGHVAVLLNRLRLFDLDALLGDRPVIAWSGGAMAISERIVLFHDNPPQGPGSAEVFDAGLAWCRGVVPLPHARSRLRLDDPLRVALFARRFAPASCMVLDAASRLDWDGSRWRARPGSLRLDAGGSLQEGLAA